jgi:dTDP-4-dehydrorhamnose 3,5-epimerase
MDIEVTRLAIAAVQIVRPYRVADSRGVFTEIWNRKTFAGAGIHADFVQENCSLSHLAGTIRGLHYQRPPAAQAKLIRIVHGRAFHVAVDLRRASPTYGGFVTTELSAEGGEQLFIPIGFAHGFCTLEPETEVAYMVTSFYAPKWDTGIRWDDPALAIPWPLAGRAPTISARDLTFPSLQDITTCF